MPPLALLKNLGDAAATAGGDVALLAVLAALIRSRSLKVGVAVVGDDGVAGAAAFQEVQNAIADSGAAGGACAGKIHVLASLVISASPAELELAKCAGPALLVIVAVSAVLPSLKFRMPLLSMCMPPALLAEIHRTVVVDLGVAGSA